MSTRVSKHFSNGQHDGWKKTVAGREWFLGYGNNAVAESRAKKLGACLEAKWQLIRLSGGTELSETDFDEVKDLLDGRSTKPGKIEVAPPHAPRSVAARAVSSPKLHTANFVTDCTPNPNRWLYETIDTFIGTLKRQIKSDNSNADHLLNTCARLIRAKDGLSDTPLDQLRRKELDDWLAFFGARPPSLTTGDPLGVVTIRNIAQAIRMFLNQCVEWEYWVPPPLWERAFKPYTIKKLSTDAEKRNKRKRPDTHNIAEKRVL